MPQLLAKKIVAALPGSLTANTLYMVKAGVGFDLYLTNDQGTVVAYPLNVKAPSAPVTQPVLTLESASGYPLISAELASLLARDELQMRRGTSLAMTSFTDSTFTQGEDVMGATSWFALVGAAFALGSTAYFTLRHRRAGGAWSDWSDPPLAVTNGSSNLAAPALAVISGPSYTTPDVDFDFPADFTPVAGVKMIIQHSTAVAMTSPSTYEYQLLQADIDSYNSETGLWNVSFPAFTFAEGDHYFTAQYQLPNNGILSAVSEVFGPHIIDTSAAETAAITSLASDLTPDVLITAGGGNFTAGEVIYLQAALNEAFTENVVLESGPATAGPTTTNTFATTLDPQLHKWFRTRRAGQRWSSGIQKLLFHPLSLGPASGFATDGGTNIGVTNAAIGAAPTGTVKRKVLIIATLWEYLTVLPQFMVNGQIVAATLVNLDVNHNAFYALVEVPAGTTFTAKLVKSTDATDHTTQYLGGMYYQTFFGKQISLGAHAVQNFGAAAGQVKQLSRNVTDVPTGGFVVGSVTQRFGGTFRTTDSFAWSNATEQFGVANSQMEYSGATIAVNATVIATSTLPGGETFTITPSGLFIPIQGI